MSKLDMLDQLSHLYQVIADEAVMGFITFDTKTMECVYANKMAHQLLEMPFDYKVENFKVEEMIPESKEYKDHFRPLDDEILGFEGFFQDILIKKMNNRLFIANIGIRKVKNEDSNYLLLMVQDMTIQKKLQKDITAKQQEIKSAYEELLEQNRQLLDLDVAKNRFIALTTHELRTPLSAMVASSEMLKLKFYDDDEQHDEFVNMIYDQGHQLLELVNDILDFSKIQAGKMDFFIEERSLHQLAEVCAEVQEQMAEQDNIKLNYEAPETPSVCYFDDVRLKQVLTNIISNAIKYNRKGGSVRIWIEENDLECVLSVSDTGKGIPPDQIESVFNEFETLGKVALHSKGTGLGMPISKRLIEGMGGSIQLKSEVGVGTTFWITVPKTRILEDELYRSRPDDETDLAA